MSFIICQGQKISCEPSNSLEIDPDVAGTRVYAFLHLVSCSVHDESYNAIFSNHSLRCSQH